MWWRSMRLGVAGGVLAAGGGALAQSLPAPVEAALARAQIPREAVSIYAAPVEAQRPVRLAWQTRTAMNPASVMKLVTTYAALEQLGPAYVWRTPVYLDGVVDQGAFRGTVYIQGAGDPKLVSERLWLLLGRLQGMGVKVIVGDVVLDHSAFQVSGHDAAAFDNEPFRPYNAGPDALLINYKTQVLGFIPDPAAGVARIHYELPMAGVQAPASVPLAPAGTACGDWRAQLQADWSDPQRIQLLGRYPASCGDKNWPVALAGPERFAARAIEGMWRSMGGQITGRVRDGQVPPGLKPAWDNVSPALTEVVRDINKFSNNVMARQLFLTLGRPLSTTNDASGIAPVTLQDAQAAVARTVRDLTSATTCGPEQLVLDNGSGLSRTESSTAACLGHWLRALWASPTMPDLVASLPLTGVDGTARRWEGAAGHARIKTGSLAGVAAAAGYVDGVSGQRHVVVGLVQHPRAAQARPVLEALLNWARQDQ